MLLKPSSFDHIELQFLLTCLNLSAYTERKALVLAARAHCLYAKEPLPTTPLYDMTIRRLNHFLPRCQLALGYKDDRDRFMLRISSLFQLPSLSGFIINYLYSLPVEDSEIESIRISSFRTELEYTQLSRRESRFDWKVLFDLRFLDRPLIDVVPVRPDVSRYIHDILIAFRRSYSDRTIFPAVSPKGVSRDTELEFLDILEKEHIHVDPFVHITPEQLLQLYLRHGRVTQGKTEMRQKWYPTGLKPRTYFAQGGTAYFGSLYLKEFFNALADTFLMTNRYSRVDPSRLTLTLPDSRFIIYDFSSFTSNMSEQYYFLMELSAFFRGTTVYLAGPLLSHYPVDLGSLIEEYADVCNDHPEFVFGSGLPVDGLVFDAAHIQAGFLGVYGNLMTSTVPHGFAARYVSTGDSSTLTAGDDGCLEPERESTALSALSALGDLSVEKCFMSDARSILLKRPFQTTRKDIWCPQRLEHPNLNFVSRGVTDRRFRHLQWMTYDDCRIAIHRQLCSVVRSLHRFDLEDYELGILESIFRTLIDVMRLGQDHASSSGRIRIRGTKGSQYVEPLVPLPWKLLENDRFTQYYPFTMDAERFVRVPRRDERPFPVDQDLVEGDILEVNSAPILTFLRQSGILRDFEPSQEVRYEFVKLSDLEAYRMVGPEVRWYRVECDCRVEEFSSFVSRVEKRYYEPVFDEEDRDPVTKRIKRGVVSGGYFDWDYADPSEVTLAYGDDYSRYE